LEVGKDLGSEEGEVGGISSEEREIEGFEKEVSGSGRKERGERKRGERGRRE